MVKLVRLTSENDCIFNANLDSDLVVSEDAQVAVQNLTFETIFPVLDIGENDAEVLFNIDRNTYTPETSRTVGVLDVKTYTSTNYQTFFPAMETALNDTLTLNQGAVENPAPPGKYQVTGQYHIADKDGQGSPDEKTINFKLSPIIHPQFIGTVGRGFSPTIPAGGGGYPELVDSNALFSISKDANTDATLEIGDNDLNPGDIVAFGGYSKPVGDASSANLDAFLYPTSSLVQWCKGSSVFYARVGSLPVGGTKDEEGFAIGLSKTQLTGRDGVAIPTASRDYEIRAYRRGDNYQFITPNSAHVPADSTPAVAPFAADPTGGGSPSGVAANDVIMLEKSGSEIIGSVITSGPGFQYVNLPLGGDFTQAPGGQTEIFDETNLGDIATYRRTQVGAAFEQWYLATSATDWNIYNTQPVAGQAADNTATIDPATGVITIVGGGAPGTTFTPAVVPPLVANGRKHQLFRYVDDDRNAALYPYMYICGEEGPAAGGTIVNWVGLTIDPALMNTMEDPDADLDDEELDPYMDYLAPQLGNVFGGDQTMMDYSVADIVGLLPQFDETFYDLAIAQNFRSVLSIAKSILRFMGFSGPEFGGAGYHHFEPRFNTAFADQYGFVLIPANDFAVANSDNYVVVLDSHPVISYDCSTIPNGSGMITTDPTAAKTGRRMNIIATIPDNDNTNGVVEFDANELVFIDLDNNYKQNISNIRARVLNKKLQPVDTVGTSVMTLLIKDTKKE